MTSHRVAMIAVIALAALAGASATHAQVRYQCRSGSGDVYYSDLPCGGDTSSAPVYYGPTEQPPSHPRPIAPIGEAPEWITYMSPRCSALHDAMRTAAARGPDYATQNEMRRNYHRECGEDEGEARTKWARERGEKRQMARTEEEQQKRAQERTKLQQEQCGESKRILVTKRQRTDLNEGEKAELQRFEANYKARCS